MDLKDKVIKELYKYFKNEQIEISSNSLLNIVPNIKQLYEILGDIQQEGLFEIHPISYDGNIQDCVISDMYYSGRIKGEFLSKPLLVRLIKTFPLWAIIVSTASFLAAIGGIVSAVASILTYIKTFR